MKENIQKQFGNVEIPHEYKYVILPVPFEHTTTYQKGCEKGPDALINASVQLELYDIETDSEPYLEGIFTAPPIFASTSKEMIDKVYESVTSYLHQNKYVITLGGEHSISFPSILAYLDHYHALTVLQFDAHADLYPHYEENPYSHASVMARVKEKGIPIIRIGLRSLGKEELPSLKKQDTFFGNEPFDINKLLLKLKGPIYITFDVDAFDPSIMPSTGTPEPGGLSWNTTLNILKEVILKRNVVGFDIVELRPLKDNGAPDFLAAKLLYKMVGYENARASGKKL